MLYKQGDREDPRNYRPITLLNTDYKVSTRVLSKRTIQVIHEIVSETQKGFVPDVFIADASMLLRLIEAYINDRG
jgi:ATP-dependent protease ClpP protease subunit